MSDGLAEAPLLDVRDLRRDFKAKSGVVHAVRGVTFSVRRGEAVALVGESGSGKTTVAGLVTCLDVPTEGKIVWQGLDTLSDHREALTWIRRNVGLVFQNAYASLNPRLSTERIIAEPLVVHRWGRRAERRRRVEELLEFVGLEVEVASRRPRDLSGGQRQRVAIARSIALNPDLVVLDEPVSALDVSVQAQILNLLTDLRAEFGLAYLFISHDLAVVRHLADQVAVMFLGRIVEHGSADQVLEHSLHPYTIALLSSALEDGEATERIILAGEPPSPLAPPSGCTFRTRCFRVQDRCVEEEPFLAQHGDHQVACHFPGRFGSNLVDATANVKMSAGRQ